MDPSRPALGWLVALGLTGTIAALAVIPPAVGGEAGHVVHRLFSAVCHQLPDRSPHLAGGPIALCHRCFGVLAGLVAGIAAAPALGSVRLRRIAAGAQASWLVAALVPTAVDWALGAFGLWANTPLSRTVTGALFGLVAGVVLAANLRSVPRPHPTPLPS